MLNAIYYPKDKRLSYWGLIAGVKTRFFQEHLSEAGARAFLREHIIRTEVVQGFLYIDNPPEPIQPID